MKKYWCSNTLVGAEKRSGASVEQVDPKLIRLEPAQKLWPGWPDLFYDLIKSLLSQGMLSAVGILRYQHEIERRKRIWFCCKEFVSYDVSLFQGDLAIDLPVVLVEVKRFS